MCGLLNGIKIGTTKQFANAFTHFNRKMLLGFWTLWKSLYQTMLFPEFIFSTNDEKQVRGFLFYFSKSITHKILIEVMAF